MNKLDCLTGNEAVAKAVTQSKVKIVPFYPITPQSEIGENLVKFGKVKLKLLDSEHSVLNYAYGYSLTGKRTFTTTSSQGLAYMSEVLPFVSGQRLPLVMAVVNRVLALPWSINSDLSDSFAQRDYGWFQIISKNVQEVYEDIIFSFKLAELTRIPVMVNLEGFFVSHAKENLFVYEDKKIHIYLKYHLNRPVLNPKKPLIFGGAAVGDEYAIFKKILHDDIKKGGSIIKKEVNKFKKLFNKNYSSLIEPLILKKGNTPLVICYGFLSNLVGYIIKEYNLNLNLIRIKFLRPFPEKELRPYINKSKKIIVIDNCISAGSKGILFNELSGFNVPKTNLIIGIGGQTINKIKLKNLLAQATNLKNNEMWYI